jgi:hypothetical protein
MRYDSAQFGAFEGKDNRRELMHMMSLLPTDIDRGGFLLKLARRSPMGRLAHVRRCGTVDGYFTLIALTNLPGITIDMAAKELEKEVRRL